MDARVLRVWMRLAIGLLAISSSGCLRQNFDLCAGATPHPECALLDASASADGGMDGGIDAGLFDAGLFDAGLFDAGLFDAGLFDAGLFDAGLFDAGGEAGPLDGGQDASTSSDDAGALDAT